MFSRDAVETITQLAHQEGIEPAALLAVVQVESGGRTGVIIGGRREPLIRFEGHYFDRRLSGAKQKLARRAGLAAPHAGAIANPRSQVERWGLLERAAEIDRRAAYESVSWGVGQVMGAHWSWLGYASVDALVGDARAGLTGQARLMLRYIRKAGLMHALQNRDWRAFARGYNGPGFARSGYDRKLARAYRAYALKGDGRLKPGARGARVSDLQTMLVALGHQIAVDGIFGPETHGALARFQRSAGLSVSGVADAETLTALRRALPFGLFLAWLRRRIALIWQRFFLRQA